MHSPRFSTLLTFITVLGAGLCLLVSSFSIAHAETIVLLPVQGDDALQEHYAEARRLTQESVRSFNHNVTDTSVTDTPAPSSPCDDSACILSLLKRTGASLALRVSLWPGEEQPDRVANITLDLIDQNGEEYPAASTVQDGDLSKAINAAFVIVFQSYRTGPGPWLYIEGGQSGARVHIDDQFVGILPYVGGIQLGQHHLAVHPPEGTEGTVHHENFTVTPGVPKVTLTLNAPSVERPPVERPSVERPTTPTKRATPLHAVIGPALLGATGIVLVGLSATHIGQGCVDVRSSGDCHRVSRTNTGPAALLLVSGGVSLGAAAFWAIRAHKKSSARTSGSSLLIGPGSVHFTTHF